MAEELYDALIIGAGPAGLTAGIYLGRFRRRCLILQDGNSRARWIPISHNIPGFEAGIGGGELLARLTRQANQYGATLHSGRVTEVKSKGGTFEVFTSGNARYVSRCLLLATGTQDHLPALPGAPEAVLRSLLRFCPICDGYEAIDKRIAVIGDGIVGEHEAQFLCTYSKKVTLLQLSESLELDPSRLPGIEVIPISLSDLVIADRAVLLRMPSGEQRRFDVVYVALGCSAQHSLARHLGASCDDHGALTVNAHQETSVSNLYAAGDVVRGLNQVIVAAAEAAIAATDIHNKLKLSPRPTQ